MSPQDELRIKTLRQRLILEAPEDDLDLQLIAAFIKFCDQMIERDYNSRIPLLEISRDLKKKCAYILQKHRDIPDLVQDAADTIWSLRRMEGRNRQFDSYLLYLEKNRQPQDMFYIPKRKQFWKIGLIQALQQMLDDELDLLTISLPPGTGKAQPLTSLVLTPDGFKQMGDIQVGDPVVSADGHPAHVLGVYPQGRKNIYEIELIHGAKCECSEEHLWWVFDFGWHDAGNVLTVTEAKNLKADPDRYMIPIYEHGGIFFTGIRSIREVGQKECQCIYVSDPSHLYITNDYIITHNTTLSKFFISGVVGWFPKDYNLFFSHNNDITRMYYDGALDIVSDHDEYTWNEIFPNLHPNHQNAKMQQFNIGKYKPFPSLQCTTRGSNNAGVVRCSKFLMVDDLIAGIEEALNRNTLDKLWDIYRVDARQRKIDGAKEIHICTRWSTADVVGRLQTLYGEDNPRCKFIAVPDIDPETGKSNFMYDVNGFSEQFFHDQEMAMDDISYRCLYKNDPIEREGLLYHEEELRRFYSLPDVEPDAVIGVCDTKSKGIDYMVLPVMYKYGEDYYLVDCICDDNSDFGVQKERLTRMIVDHEMQQCEFESNAGGDRLAADVAEMVAREKGRCNITTKATETNKETRIIVNSDWIKKHVLFKSPEQYQRKSDYGRLMNFLCTYSVAGKNVHDDVPDCLANFVLFVTRGIHRRKTRIMRSPL